MFLFSLNDTTIKFVFNAPFMRDNEIKKGRFMMKKLFSLLLTAMLLCSAFAVPASAENITTITGTEEITENSSFQILSIENGAKVTVKSGVTLTVAALMNNGTLVIEPGATVIAQSGFFNDSDAVLELGGTLTSDDNNGYYWLAYSFMGDVTIKSDGTIDAVVRSDDNIAPLLSDLKGYCVHISGSRFTVQSAHDMINNVCSQCGKTPCDINGERHIYTNGKCTKCGYVCPNDFHRNSGQCPECGMRVSFSAGSVFSNGGITIIVGFAGLLIGMAVMFLIMKKKPATANGAAAENPEKEDE